MPVPIDLPENALARLQPEASRRVVNIDNALADEADDLTAEAPPTPARRGVGCHLPAP